MAIRVGVRPVASMVRRTLLLCILALSPVSARAQEAADLLSEPFNRPLVTGTTCAGTPGCRVRLDEERTLADDWPCGVLGGAVLVALTHWLHCRYSDVECDFDRRLALGSFAVGFVLGVGLAPGD